VVLHNGVVWYGMVYVDVYSAIVAKVPNTLCTLVPRKQPSFQALFEGAEVLLHAEVVWQSSKTWGHAQRMLGGQQLRSGVVAQLVPRHRIRTTIKSCVADRRRPVYRQRRLPVCNSQQGTAEPCHVDICV